MDRARSGAWGQLGDTAALNVGDEPVLNAATGVQPTLDLGAQLLGRNSVWTIVGGGRHEFRHGSTPCGAVMGIPYWGSRVEPMEVIAMARDGRIHAETTEFPLTEAVASLCKAHGWAGSPEVPCWCRHSRRTVHGRR